MTVVVERGSTHIQWQHRELLKEAELCSLEVRLPDSRSIEQELAEYESADYIAVPSSFAARTFVAAGIPETKLLINPLGVDLKLFSKTELSPDSNPETAHGLRVLYVGGVTVQKGVHYLIAAVDRVPGATLTLVGGISPGMATYVRRHTKTTAVGPVSGRDLPYWYQRADAFCLLSVDDGFGLVLVQAMAMGLPVIASAHTAAENLIDHGVHGFIVPARDPEAAAAHLQQLADAPDLRREMGERARARVIQRFGWSHYGARARAHYARIMAQRGKCLAATSSES